MFHLGVAGILIMDLSQVAQYSILMSNKTLFYVKIIMKSIKSFVVYFDVLFMHASLLIIILNLLNYCEGTENIL